MIFFTLQKKKKKKKDFFGGPFSRKKENIFVFCLLLPDYDDVNFFKLTIPLQLLRIFVMSIFHAVYFMVLFILPLFSHNN